MSARRHSLTSSISMPDLSDPQHQSHSKTKRKSEPNIKLLRPSRWFKKKKPAPNPPSDRTSGIELPDINEHSVGQIPEDDCDGTVVSESSDDCQGTSHDSMTESEFDSSAKDTDSITSLLSDQRNALKDISRSTPTMSPSGSPRHSGDSVIPHDTKSTKKFHKHFNGVDLDEKVLNYYAGAYVAEILHQGTLYITENYFAFYSNIFGFVNRILIPICDVAAIKKKKTASFIPNAVGVETRDGKAYVFSSLISRDNTFRFMEHMFKKSQEILDTDSEPSYLRTIKTIEPPVDSSSEEEEEELIEPPPLYDTPTNLPLPNGLVHSTPEKAVANEAKHDVIRVRKAPPTLLQPPPTHLDTFKSWIATPLTALAPPTDNPHSNVLLWSCLSVVVGLLISAMYMMYRVEILSTQIHHDDVPTYESIYEEVLHMQQKLHSATSEEVERTISSQLEQLAVVRQSLDSLVYLFNRDPTGQRLQD